MNQVLEKNNILEKDVKNLKVENENMKARLNDQEKELESFKKAIDSLVNKEEIENQEVIGDDPENENVHQYEKFDFIGKTEGGLKTHGTTKHKTVSLRGYRKISWNTEEGRKKEELPYGPCALAFIILYYFMWCAAYAAIFVLSTSLAL